MAQVYLHVGAHKTATSYLQAMFHRNHDLLAAHGVHYPRIGPTRGQHVLAAVWQRVPAIVPPEDFGPDGPGALWDQLVRDYADRDGILFLSAENFSRNSPQRVDMAEIARRLAPFEAVHAIYTARQQTDLVSSMWSEITKKRSSAITPAALVTNVLERPTKMGVPLDHRIAYALLREGLPPERIHLLDYETIRHHPHGVLGAFLNLLGVAIDPGRFQPIAEGLANVSPDPLALYMATQIWPGVVPDPERVAQVAAAMNPEGRPTSALTRGEHLAVAKLFAPANAELAAMVREWQPGFAVTELPPPKDMFYRNMITHAVWARVAAALYEARPARPAMMGRQLPDRLRRLLHRRRPGG